MADGENNDDKRHTDRRPGFFSMLTRAEAAEEIGVSVSSLAHWSRKGLGPRPYLIGRRAYYQPADIAEWFKSRHGARRGA
jgi:DNA-binding transcriptional MerR regulator